MANANDRRNGGAYVDVPPTPYPGGEVRRKRGRPKALVVIASGERTALEQLVRNEVAEPQLALRARVVLMCATGMPDVTVAAQLAKASDFISKWRLRFVRYRVNGLFDQPRLGAEATHAIGRFEAAVKEAVKQVPRSEAALRGAIVRVTVRLP